MVNVQLQVPANFDLKNPDSWVSWKGLNDFTQRQVSTNLDKVVCCYTAYALKQRMC